MDIKQSDTHYESSMINREKETEVAVSKGIGMWYNMEYVKNINTDIMSLSTTEEPTRKME